MSDRHLELEIERFVTFADWPTNAPVQVEDLVKNGFFATGNWLEAECNWCHIRIDHWEYGDNVAERHRRGSPICSMVLAPNHCGNVPMHDPQQMAAAAAGETNDSEGNTVVDGGASLADMLIEENRLETFKDWPNPNITPEELAKAGFYYLYQSDHVKCVWCKGIIAKWEKNDNAFDEHRRFFPNCPRVQMGPLIAITGKNIEELGIQPTTLPQRPKYSCMETRLRTFSDWPIPNIQAAEPLAQAGLYYQKIDDQVRCFHCNIGLRSWQKDDEPWHEHAKWSPKCQFVLLAKGPNFVRAVREAPTTSTTAATAPPLPTSIDSAMTAAPACEALALGIDVGAVRNTIARKLSSSGCAFNTLDDLLHAIFDDAGAGAALEVTEPFSCASAPQAPNEPVDCSATTSKAAQAETHNTTGAAVATAATSPAAPLVPAPAMVNSNSNPNGNLSLEEENRLLKDARLCKVCLDEEVGVVFLPCGHLATCNQCAPSVANCPMCRADIKGYVRTFLS
ncbi:death-associated inhibitor of apoptosis 2 [Drosophila albomicans]|uniref:Death-associated inhibitor of apoptosis 2 n=1 Tax=Drosophila albomicans TaxID=7291 RepID=A0A6P8WR93_DROAB|nr:death-associated inhibitor of apoptosis 2 [Drosophila albomicans]